MKKCLFYFLALLFFSNQAFAQASPSSTHVLPEIPRINAYSAYQEYKSGSVFIIAADPEVTYRKYHLVGSINLPNDGPEDIERVKNMELTIPKNKKIIVYCG